MAKPGLTQVTTFQTFQSWLDKTNDIVGILNSEAVTASPGSGDTTTGNSTLVGSFTANTIIAFDTLRTDTFSPKVGSSSISVTAPINTTTSSQVVQTLTSIAGPRLNFSSTTNVWRAGFEDTSNNNFVIDFGTGTPKLRISTAGNLSTVGSITSGLGGFVGNLAGDINGSVTVPSTKTFNIENASSIVLPPGFGIVPKGGIIMWSGISVPVGWGLCNGSSYTFNGVMTTTPDLRDRFIVGAGSGYTVGDQGGANNVTLTASQIPSHTHAFSGTTSTAGAHTHDYQVATYSSRGDDNNYQLAIGNVTAQTSLAGNHSHTFSGITSPAGSGGSHENRPPYYALAFIMKL
jgi:microcystin-dependent protein